MNTKYFETSSYGLKYINEAIKNLEIKVTSETSVEELHLIHNAINAYSIDKLIIELKKVNLLTF